MTDSKTFSLNRNLILIIGITFLIISLNYANGLFSPFQFDDENIIKHNPDIKNSYYLQITDIKYRHFFYFTFILNYIWGGLDPFGYHLFNILLHFATTIVVFFISFVTIEKGVLWSREAAFKIACITSLFFALNPAHSETVTYISGRGSGLSGFFYLLSLLMFILGSLNQVSVRFSWVFFYLFSLAAFALAVFSKEASVTLPAVIILYDICFIRYGNWDKFWKRLVFFYLLFPVFIIIFLKKLTPLFAMFHLWLNKFDIFYALSQLEIIGNVIKLYFIPVNMAFTYDLSKKNSFTDPTYIISILLLIAILFLIFKKFYLKSAILSFSMLWFIITISPTNSILPRMDLFSDRNLYLPSFGLSLFFAVLVYLTFTYFQKKYLYGPFIGFACIAIILITNSALLIKRNSSYQTNISLWERTYEKSPGNMRVVHNLGHYYLTNNMPKKAFVMLKRLVTFNPSNYYAHVNLGKIYLDSGKGAKAEEEFIEAIKVNPDFPEAYFNLGSYYASKGLFVKAKAEYDKADQRYGRNSNRLPALFLNEIRAKLILNKAKVNKDLGLFKESEKELKRYLKIHADSAEGNYLLGQIYAKIGKEELAIKAYRKSKGNRLLQAKSHSNVGLIYIKQNKYEDAILEFKKAISINPSLMEAQFNLGKILLEVRNDSKNARIHLERALMLQPDRERAKIIKKELIQLNN